MMKEVEEEEEVVVEVVVEEEEEDGEEATREATCWEATTVACLVGFAPVVDSSSSTAFE